MVIRIPQVERACDYLPVFKQTALELLDAFWRKNPTIIANRGEAFDELRLALADVADQVGAALRLHDQVGPRGLGEGMRD